MKHLVRTSALLTILVALLTLGLIAPGSATTATSAVKGVITLDGTPLKGLTIELYWTGTDGFEGSRIAVDTTDSKGAYSFKFNEHNPLDPADEFGHTIIIRDPSYRIIATSRTFHDHPGKTATRNASVKAAASITGSLKRGDGHATNALRINVFGPYALLDQYHETSDEDVYDNTVKAAADGSFALRGLPAGDYYLEFVDDGQTYFSQCYDNIPADDRRCDGTSGDTNATKISVTAAQDVTLNPQVLSTSGQTISGTVTDVSGNPVKSAGVGAVDDGGHNVAGTSSHSTGNFTIGPLTHGSYRLVVPAGLNYASQWFDRKSAEADATVVDLTGGDVSGIHIKLKSNSSMKVHLTPGKGTVTGSFDVTRLATAGKASGTVTISWGAITKTVTLVKGLGTAKLSGLPKGTRKITVTYSGSPSTVSNTKILHTAVR